MKGKDFLEVVRKKVLDLVLLDVFLLDMFGLEVLVKLREFYKELFVIMLFVFDMEMDKVKVFDLGVDDYMFKLFGILELIVRMNVYLRKLGVCSIIIKGNVIIDKEKYKCFVGNDEVVFMIKEFDVFYFIMKNDGKVVIKEIFFNEIW